MRRPRPQPSRRATPRPRGLSRGRAINPCADTHPGPTLVRPGLPRWDTLIFRVETDPWSGYRLRAQAYHSPAYAYSPGYPFGPDLDFGEGRRGHEAALRHAVQLAHGALNEGRARQAIIYDALFEHARLEAQPRYRAATRS
jgi:hypothetical protein